MSIFLQFLSYEIFFLFSGRGEWGLPVYWKRDLYLLVIKNELFQSSKLYMKITRFAIVFCKYDYFVYICEYTYVKVKLCEGI